VGWHQKLAMAAALDQSITILKERWLSAIDKEGGFQSKQVYKRSQTANKLEPTIVPGPLGRRNGLEIDWWNKQLADLKFEMAKPMLGCIQNCRQPLKSPHLSNSDSFSSSVPVIPSLADGWYQRKVVEAYLQIVRRVWRRYDCHVQRLARKKLATEEKCGGGTSIL